MATPSPQPPQTNGKTTPKLFETIGTFGRKKKIREGLFFLSNKPLMICEIDQFS